MTLCFKAEFRNLILCVLNLFFIFIVIINGFILYHLLFMFPRFNENMNMGRKRKSVCSNTKRRGGNFSGKRLYGDHLPFRNLLQAPHCVYVIQTITQYLFVKGKLSTLQICFPNLSRCQVSPTVMWKYKIIAK